MEVSNQQTDIDAIRSPKAIFLAKTKKQMVIRLTLTCIRWLIILGCFGFVAWGWYNSGMKACRKTRTNRIANRLLLRVLGSRQEVLV